MITDNSPEHQKTPDVQGLIKRGEALIVQQNVMLQNHQGELPTYRDEEPSNEEEKQLLENLESFFLECDDASLPSAVLNTAEDNNEGAEDKIIAVGPDLYALQSDEEYSRDGGHRSHYTILRKSDADELLKNHLEFIKNETEKLQQKGAKINNFLQVTQQTTPQEES